MKLENQVCTIEQAKKLYKYGIIGSTYKWVKFEWEEDGEYKLMDIWTIDSENYPAFTVAELGLLIDWNHCIIATPYKHHKSWQICFNKDDFESEYEAVARCEALLFMLKKKLVSVEEVNKKLLQ